MAKFLAAKHVAVNAIAPGYFPSKMTAAIDEEGSQYVIDNAPMKRMGNPNDMAGIALYLASKASGFVCVRLFRLMEGLQRRLMDPSSVLLSRTLAARHRDGSGSAETTGAGVDGAHQETRRKPC